MTPKEKAEWLLDEMSKQTYEYQPYAGANYIKEEIGYEAGKKCAIIAINEIIKQWEYIDAYLADLNGELNPNLKYWYEVRAAI
jgi:hypothetical protein